MKYTGKEGEERSRSPQIAKVLNGSQEGQQKPHQYTGWSMLADGSGLDSAKSPKKKQNEPNGWFDDLEPISGEAVKPCDIALTARLRRWFEYFHGAFLKVFSASNSFRPLPPILGDGQCADLFKLFLIVKEKGGCDAVSKNGLWVSVAEESGFGWKLTPAVKLVYIKYLDAFERWLNKVFEGKCSDWCLGNIASDEVQFLMELQTEFKGVLSQVLDRKVGLEDYPSLDLSCDLFIDSVDEVKSSVVGLDASQKRVDIGMVKQEVELNGGRSGENLDEGLKVLHSAPVDEEKLLRKRKRENDEEIPFSDDGKLLDKGEVKRSDNCEEDIVKLEPATNEDMDIDAKVERVALCGLLDWVRKVAMNPCDPALGHMPPSSTWNSYGNEEIWRQALLAREAVSLKRKFELGSDQKNLRMHPGMYDDDKVAGSYNLRERVVRNKNPSTHASSDSEDNVAGVEEQTDKKSLKTSEQPKPPKKVPVGRKYQAKIPEWTGEAYESDDKWLGTKIWPLEKEEPRFLIERDPIGRGRQGSCGCENEGSMECVRFHIAEKRLRLMRELGTAFFRWEFNKMGDEVALSWTAEEEKKFDEIICANPPSLGITFWDDLRTYFRKKSRKELVSYYYNVYLLRRRAHQNRFTPDNICSDDDVEEEVQKDEAAVEVSKSCSLTREKRCKK
ncbi:hypothetical protein UlMin_022493 [Ulmus minor]